MNDNRKFSDLFEKLFNTLYGFTTKRFIFNSFSEIIEETLKFYYSFPNSLAVGYYALNKESFQFEYIQSLPIDNNYDWNKVLHEMVENGVVGKSVSNGLISIDSFLKLEDANITIPLVGANGVIGLIILAIENFSLNLDLTIIKLGNLFARIAASTIESHIVNDENRKTKELLEQMVAARVISLQKSKFELGEKIEKMKTDLSMSIPHEVRTPINQILGFSDYLIKYISEDKEFSIEDTVEILIDIKNSSIRLKRLFENYLYYAQLAMLAQNIGEIQALKHLSIDTVESIIYDSAMSVAANYNRQNDLTINIVDAPVNISETYLIKIVEELVDNGIKFSEPGTQILINSFIDGNKYVISFQDYGRGMSDKHIGNIDAYQQFERNIYEQQGLGLGLTIVRKIIDLFDGEIIIKSEINHYTFVNIILNLAMNTDSF